MRDDTKPFGIMEVEDKQCLEFPSGLFGFEQLKRYVLLDAVQSPFYWLQSLDRSEIAFVLLDPRTFLPGYQLDVDGEDLREIGVENEEDVLDFAIVTVPDDPATMTANLQGPVVVNRRAKVGRQCISRDPAAAVRYNIMDALAMKAR